MTVTFDSIATTTLGSAAATITFSSIPATYTDLRATLVCPGGTFLSIRIRFNSDTGTNYSITQLYGNGTSATSVRSTSVANLYFMDAASSAQPTFGAFDVFSYAGSTNKTVLLESSEDTNGGGTVGRRVGLWRNTAAITTITLLENTGANFPIGTTATLYGIKSE